MTMQLALSPRPAAKAAIKRASARARAEMNRFDRARLGDLDALYRRAAAALEQDILGYASSDGSLRLEVLRQLLAQVNARLDVLSRARDDLFGPSLLEAARIGVDPFRAAPGVGIDLVRIPEEAVRFVQSFVGEDGLQLSDRIWRLDRGARETVSRAVESAVIQGHSASRAIDDFLARGEAAPAALQAKMRASSAGAVGRAARDALVGGDADSARANAMRVFRTEMNRAHGEAYRAAAFEHPEVIGTRFLLSPNHPRHDICDMHASVNRYGLGPGVYPPGKSPWPAHPNTLSYEEVVFSDEVTPEDRAGKEGRIDWLERQAPGVQESVLGGRKKRAALQRGLLKEHQIATPWRVLRQRYERQGIDVESLTVVKPDAVISPSPVASPPPPSAPSVQVSSSFSATDHKARARHVGDIIDSVHSDGVLPEVRIVRYQTANPSQLGRYEGSPSRHTIRARGDHIEHTLVHEIGHFIDHRGFPGAFWASHHDPVLAPWRKAVYASDAIKQIRQELSEPGGFAAYAEYLLEPHEAWARSYAQWITRKSGDPVLREQLARIRQDLIPAQWADDDFAPISDAIDEVMRAMGWL